MAKIVQLSWWLFQLNHQEAGTIGPVTSLLAATRYEENHNSTNKTWNVVLILIWN